jgi:dihydropteroate synthase
VAATAVQWQALVRALAPTELATALAALPPAQDPPGVPPPVHAGPYTLPFGRKTYVVAIVNVTPDSFSEELGRVPGAEETEARVRRAVAEGADIVDIGAESSEARDRGGEAAAEEIRRLLPVLERIGDLPVPISVDTRRASVADAVLRAGAHIINDVDALADPGMTEVAARHGCPIVVMHSQAGTDYPGDLMDAIAGFLEAAVARAVAAGVAREQVIVDAGFGFGKTIAQDLEHTRRLGELRRLGRPILHAPSRKRTIGRVLGFPASIPERLPGTAAAVALGIAAGADLVRVHDVLEMARVARMADAIVRGWEGGEGS